MSKQAAQPTPEINAMMEPWLKAFRAWNSESEKFQKVTMERMHKALEDSHQVTRETLEMAANVRSTVQKQVNSQMERTCDWMTSVLP